MVSPLLEGREGAGRRDKTGASGKGVCLPSHLSSLGFAVRAPVVCLVKEVALEPLALL